MNILTLIPSANVYGVMVLAMLSLGSFNIARHIHIRWLKNTLSFVATNALVKSAIGLFGLAIIPFSALFAMNVWSEIASISLGIIFGFASIFIEVIMVRHVNRKNLLLKNAKLIQQKNNGMVNTTMSTKLSLSSSPSIAAKGIKDIRNNYTQYADAPDFLNYSLFAVMTVAIAEEFLFRGYLTVIAHWMQPMVVTVVIILVSLSAFAFSHVSSSWREFIYKLPLSLFTTMSFIMTGSLMGAIITHLFLNIYAYVAIRKRMPTNNQSGYMPTRMSL